MMVMNRQGNSFEQDVLAHIQCSFAAAEYQVFELRTFFGVTTVVR
jgi:hypothetical protein